MRLLALACLSLACGRLGYDPAQLSSSDASADAPVTDTDAADVTDGLIAHYTFDVDLLSDETGNHPAMCEGGCPMRATTPAGSGLLMQGNDPHLRVADDGSFQTTTAFTVAGSVVYNSITTRTCIFTKPLGTANANSWALCTDSDTQPFLFVCTPACATIKPNVPLSGNTSYHLAARFDGTQSCFYLDGANLGCATGAVSFDDTALVIGGDVDNAMYNFSTDGVIDDLRVYDRALSDDEISTIAGL